ncbi:hypothetical protein HMPREF9093_00161 [Fusobacterium sp. oral taxon 370 str. F0437]|uniref:GNAT family N-acetyltransferase n=1 Tax=Fusobacterium sp. oral taxon 370 TaxID=712288 RepID=UPI000234A4B7|nr:GNAT family N-acetyltransferase [Fusobacterium sp. oral taxon 370]EHI79567.1 hypothetical protein HMPREF9093_00161 [Fusobacterium sp. oral taxon 370 str. F0437]
MNKKEKYKLLCKENPIPLFSQWYWLDSVCGKDDWDVIILENGNEILATIPYSISIDEFGNKVIQKIPLTQNNGAFIFYRKDIEKYETRLSFEMKVINLVIDEIEKLPIKKYRQYYHYNFTNWLPFYWRGYKQTTRYTYVIDKNKTIDEIYKGFDGQIRKALKKAEKSLEVKENLDSKIFYSLVEKTYSRQNIKIPFGYDTLKNIYKNLEENNSLKIFYAVDKEKNIHSAVLMGIDQESVYYLISGTDEKFRNSQALTLLIYQGILLAIKENKKFDFEGSMKKNIEIFFRKFGAEQKQYFDISKEYL